MAHMGYHTLLALEALCNSEKFSIQRFHIHHIYFFKYIYLTPVKTQRLQYNLTQDLMLFYHSNQIKHKPMVAISSQYSFGADKAVQISQAVFFDKGTQPELRHKNCKSPY